MAESRIIEGDTVSIDLVPEAERILAAAHERGVLLRLFGGVAIALRCGTAAHSALRRTYQDLDFAALGRQREAVTALLTGAGYEADRTFNTIHGHQRLLFSGQTHGRQVDVVFDRLRMSHTFDLRDRLAVDDRTLPLADLLLFKLQVIEANEKDVTDAIALLGAHPLGGDDRAINVVHIARLAADDWGLCHTLERSLARVRAHPLAALPDLPFPVAAQVETLQQRLAAEPKSTRWKLRARVGERVRWYELPEEARE